MGTFDGQNHTITGLYIDRSDGNYVGLFGFADTGAIIANTGLVDVSVTGDQRVGALVGWNQGNITDCYSTANANGDNEIGGLVGQNGFLATIMNSFATGHITGYTLAGGLVGNNIGSATITNSFATGDVNSNDNEAGGLVGYNFNYGTITNCYASGNVTGRNHVGGLVGWNEMLTSIANCYATGDVNGNDRVGGLVGELEHATLITNSFATGNVNGGGNVGGLVGRNVYGGTITNCYWNNRAGSPDHCYSGGDEGCTAIHDSVDYFKGDVYPNNPSMSEWSFYDIWEECEDDFPALAWEERCGIVFVRGDVAPSGAQDGECTTADGLMILGYYYGDTGLDCMDAGDVDDNGQVTMGDGLRALGYYFGDPGTTPELPFPTCGIDSSFQDDLDCVSHSYCMGAKATASKLVNLRGAPNKLALEQAVLEDDMLRVPLDLVISEDVLGCAFLVDYDASQLSFVGLVGGEAYDFYRSHVVDEASGSVRVGCIPDLELKEVFAPGEHRVAELEFKVKGYAVGVEFGLDEVEVVGTSFAPLPVEWVAKPGVSNLPSEFALSQNYPNPFNPTTLIKYDLPVDCQVRLDVYNILGQKVVTLVDGPQAPGYWRVRWNGRDGYGREMASGIYFYRLKAGRYAASRKLLLLK